MTTQATAIFETVRVIMLVHWMSKRAERISRDPNDKLFAPVPNRGTAAGVMQRLDMAGGAVYKRIICYRKRRRQANFFQFIELGKAQCQM
jgi:hypothetical protein